MIDVPVQRYRLSIEGSGCCEPDITVGLVYDFLESLTVDLGMRVLDPPSIVRVPIPNHLPTDDFGISGQLMWMESGAQVHCWPACGFVAVDIFSCRPFEDEVATECFRSFFLPTQIEIAHPVFKPRQIQDA